MIGRIPIIHRDIVVLQGKKAKWDEYSLCVVCITSVWLKKTLKNNIEKWGDMYSFRIVALWSRCVRRMEWVSGVRAEEKRSSKLAQQYKGEQRCWEIGGSWAASWSTEKMIIGGHEFNLIYVIDGWEHVSTNLQLFFLTSSAHLRDATEFPRKLLPILSYVIVWPFQVVGGVARLGCSS